MLLDFADERSVVQTRFATTRAHAAARARGRDVAAAAADAERGARRCRSRSSPARPTSWTFLGRGWTVGLAHEAALKLREAAQAWTESYPVLEYRHGPISIAGPGAACGRSARPTRRRRRASAQPARPVAPDLDPLPSLVLAQRTAVALAEAARARPRQPPQPRAVGGPDDAAPEVLHERLLAHRALAVLDAARRRRCGGSSDEAPTPEAGGPVEITFWHGQNDIAGKVLERARRRVQRAPTRTSRSTRPPAAWSPTRCARR